MESAVFREWRTLRNSELIEKAHQHGFTALVTSDKRLAKEQRHLPIAVVVVDDNRLEPLRASLHDIAQAIREDASRYTSDRQSPPIAPAGPEAE